MNQQPVIFRAVERGRAREPIAIRPELNETQPRHADMLRYDAAFHHPQDVSLLVFPIFKVAGGVYPQRITGQRWGSYVMQLDVFWNFGRHNEKDEPTFPDGVTFAGIGNIDEWITYIHRAPDYGTLHRITFAEYLTLGDVKRKVVGYRS